MSNEGGGALKVLKSSRGSLFAFVVPDIYYSNVVKELLESYSEIINLLLKLLIAGKKFPVGLKKLFLKKYQLVVEVRFTLGESILHPMREPL